MGSKMMIKIILAAAILLPSSIALCGGLHEQGSSITITPNLVYSGVDDYDGPMYIDSDSIKIKTPDTFTVYVITYDAGKTQITSSDYFLVNTRTKQLAQYTEFIKDEGAAKKAGKKLNWINSKGGYPQWEHIFSTAVKVMEQHKKK